VSLVQIISLKLSRVYDREKERKRKKEKKKKGGKKEKKKKKKKESTCVSSPFPLLLSPSIGDHRFLTMTGKKK
jgi:hypothetical protein